MRKDQMFDTMNVQCPDFYSLDSTTFACTLINNMAILRPPIVQLWKKQRRVTASTGINRFSC